MTRYIKIMAILCLLTSAVKAQWFHEGIDTVYSFFPGSGQNAGQGSEYYPANIFGLPDTSASETFQSSSPYQILSIGLDGQITVGFKNYIVADGPGADFTVFENAFLNPVTDKVFAEPGKISVSQDGVKFYDFPFDSVSLMGCAGVTPTNGKSNPFDPSVSGGDKFDLSTLGLKWIKYIRITDICRMLLNNPKLPYYDPMITGFDLDAVVGLHLVLEKQTEGVNDAQNSKIQIKNVDNIIYIQTDNSFFSVYISDINGNLIYNSTSYQFIAINKLSFIKGVYILNVISGNEKQSVKFIN